MSKLMSKFKRIFYMEQLKLLGIKEVDQVPVQYLSDRELKYALTLARAKVGV